MNEHRIGLFVYFVKVGSFFSLLLFADLFTESIAKLAALDGDKDVGVLCRGRHKLGNDVLCVTTSAHS